MGGRQPGRLPYNSERARRQSPGLGTVDAAEVAARRGYRGNCGSGYLLGGETVADDLEKAFNFFNRYYGASAAGKAMAAREGERDEVFPFLNGRGFIGFDSFTAEFGSELLCHGGEDRDGKGPIFLL